MNDTLSNLTAAESKYVSVDGLRIHYHEYGSGRPVLLLHGWPTSSFLWRNVAPVIADAGRRVIVPDLPGFGLSDKPLHDGAYSFGSFAKMLDGFCAALGLETTALVVHDLGGPVGLYWACRNPERIERLGILNTIVYPEMSWAVKLFIGSLQLPLTAGWLCSPAGLRFAMWLGMFRSARLTAEVYAGVTAPFPDADSREALRRAGGELSGKGFFLISQKLKRFKVPVRIIYGERDWILPDIADTARRLQEDLPHAELTALSECGHFLQEDDPETVGRLLAEFLASGQ